MRLTIITSNAHAGDGSGDNKFRITSLQRSRTCASSWPIKIPRKVRPRHCLHSSFGLRCRLCCTAESSALLNPTRTLCRFNNLNTVYRPMPPNEAFGQHALNVQRLESLLVSGYEQNGSGRLSHPVAFGAN